VAREKILILPRNRPLKTHHRIYPWSKLCLDPELGVCAVLTAAIGDPIINHQNLAVIAQIDASSQRTQEGIADGQGGSQLNAGRLHGFPMWGLDHDASPTHRPSPGR